MAGAAVTSGAAGHGEPSAGMAEYIADLAKARPDLVRLAECLSLAAGVERSFLRRARLRFLPQSTAGIEAELWFSPLVEAAGDQTLLIDPEAGGVLRRRLARRSLEHIEAVRQFTEDAHRHAQPLTRWFEELLWADLSPSTATSRLVGDKLRKVLDAVTSVGEAADDLGRWALHYLPRLPAGVRRHDDAWRIQVASSERLGLEPPHDPFGRPASVAATARALVQRDVPIGVSVRSDGLVLSWPPAEDSLTVRAVGVRTVRLDAASILTPLPASNPVRLELRRDQSVRLPFAAVQRLDTDGQPKLSIAHAGGAAEAAVASTATEGAQYAVLLPDGAIALHGVDGRPAGRVPPPAEGAVRRCLTMSADGTQLAWIEDGAVGQYESTTGQARILESPDGEEACCVYFSLEARAGLVRAYTSGSTLTVEGSEGRSSAVAMTGFTNAAAATAQSLWWSWHGSHLAVIDGSGDLWLLDGRLDEDSHAARELLGREVTAVTGSLDGRVLVWARADGSVVCRGPWGRDESTAVGSAPWQVTSLAVSVNGGRVAAAGGDSRLMLWGLGLPASLRREVRLDFCADRVFALADGDWAVSGAGGPVELSTEDGRRYVVTPETQALDADDEVPAWIRGCVLADVGHPGAPSGFPGLAASMESIRAAGVRCLVVGPVTPSARGDGLDGIPLDEEMPHSLGDFGEFMTLLMAAHHHGVRVVVDVDLMADQDSGAAPVPVARMLNSVRQWLDRDVDGVRVLAPGHLARGVLSDLRHLMEGYDGRVLMSRRPAAPAAEAADDFQRPDDSEAACHVVTRSLDRSLGDAIRDRRLGDYYRGSFGMELSTLEAVLELARPGSQWSHQLPVSLDSSQQRLAAAVLLSIPGAPVLPLSLLQQEGMTRLLELRRGHLALSRGRCRVQRYAQRQLLGIVRTHGDETVLCLVNSGTGTESVAVHPESLVAGQQSVRLLDLFDGTAVICAMDAPATLTVAGGGVRWLRVLPAPSTFGPEE
ncbi:alpha-amylase family protein [Streptomyces sp. NPDC051907]|uniref:alpha-amylase family protein n=1 Tax=Streptomyces sp. NPDC051907 TaxID=3155284 RepID=UPI0034286E56